MFHKTEKEIMKTWEGDPDSPKVSISCLAFNQEDFIEESLKSFLMQETSFPFEIIIRDDASTDNTVYIIKEYEKKYPNIIKPIYEVENGYSKNIKGTPIILQKAKGKYIAVCDGDDYWTDKEKLQKQVDFLENNLDYAITYSDIQAFDENGDLEKNYGGVSRDTSSEELQKCISLSTATVCYRNNELFKHFPMELSTAKYGDLFLWSLIGNYGKGKYLSNIEKTKYRVHNKGIFSKQSQIHKKNMWLFTAFSLYMYYYRIQNEELSKYFLKEVLKTSLGLIGSKQFFKIILKRILKIK